MELSQVIFDVMITVAFGLLCSAVYQLQNKCASLQRRIERAEAHLGIWGEDVQQIAKQKEAVRQRTRGTPWEQK